MKPPFGLVSWSLFLATVGCTVGDEAGPMAGGIDAGGPSTSPAVDAATTEPPIDTDSLAAACNPVVTYTNEAANGDGALFDDHVSDVQAYFTARSLDACKILYKHGSEVPPRPTLKFVVDSHDGVAYCACSNDTCDEMHLSANYLRDYKNGGGNLAAEIDGVITHELTHIFQHMGGGAPGWLIEGEADFVRFRAGRIPVSNRRPGGNYDDAYQTTAFFFDYVDKHYLDFAWKLNRSKDPALGEPWSEQVFVDLTGKSVQTLWNEYQDSL